MTDLPQLAQGLPAVLIAQLLSGAVGGALAGRFLREFSLGPLWNALAGLLGGAAGAQGLLALGLVPAGGIPMEALSRGAVSGLSGGALVIVLLGLLKSIAHR
jgi:hypothetical protein